jgi:hypothetical protein
MQMNDGWAIEGSEADNTPCDEAPEQPLQRNYERHRGTCQTFFG